MKNRKKWESFYAKSRNLNDDTKIGFFYYLTYFFLLSKPTVPIFCL